MCVARVDAGGLEYDQPSTGHFHGLLVYSRPKSAAAEKGVLIWGLQCKSMDHLLSAGYLVESGVSSSSFSTHLLTFSNNQQQSEQVGIRCKTMIDTFHLFFSRWQRSPRLPQV